MKPKKAAIPKITQPERIEHSRLEFRLKRGDVFGPSEFARLQYLRQRLLG